MHEETIQQAIDALNEIDPEQKLFGEIVNGLSAAISGKNSLVALMATTAVIDGICQIDSENQDALNFMYHVAIGSLVRSAADAGVFEDFEAQLEKYDTALKGESVDN